MCDFTWLVFKQEKFQLKAGGQIKKWVFPQTPPPVCVCMSCSGTDAAGGCCAICDSWPHTSGLWVIEDTLCGCSSPLQCCPRRLGPCLRRPPTADCHSYRLAAGRRCLVIGWAATGSAGSLPPPLAPSTRGRLAPGLGLLVSRPDREPRGESDHLRRKQTQFQTVHSSQKKTQLTLTW